MKRLALTLVLAALLVSAAALVGPTVQATEVRIDDSRDAQQARAAQVVEIGGEATLRAAFNKDKGKVRLLMILSPT